MMFSILEFTIALFSYSSVMPRYKLGYRINFDAPYHTISNTKSSTTQLLSTISKTDKKITTERSTTKQSRKNGFKRNQEKKSKKTPSTYQQIKAEKRAAKYRNSSSTSPNESSSSSSIRNSRTEPKVVDVPLPEPTAQQTFSTNTNIHDINARINHIHSIKSTRTMEENKRSHERMIKAQQLLRDVSSQKEVQLDPKSIQTYSEGEEGQPVQMTTTVPDTFWYNGNLEEGNGDFVTRWARGVKVAEPLVKYDPIAAEKLLFRQPGKWILRNIQIGFPLALWAGGVIFDIIRQEEEINRRNRAKQLLRTISNLGPAIIKGGQALSSRSDLLPSEYLEELQKLQDDVPRFENDVAFARVEEELGDSFENIFELVESEPVAAASKYKTNRMFEIYVSRIYALIICLSSLIKVLVKFIKLDFDLMVTWLPSKFNDPNVKR